ncbi:hypothetical protein C8R45DRAFT_1104214 [Mycena sanguinolenta]|nr:hypothetical protein C8R45DRAFT_1104214 [Mycena sanguinolenta]
MTGAPRSRASPASILLHSLRSSGPQRDGNAAHASDMESTLNGPSFVSYCDFLRQKSTLVTPYSAPSPFSGLQFAIAVLTLVHHLRLPRSPLICPADAGRRTPRSTYLSSKPCLFEQCPPRTDLRRWFRSPCPWFATPDVDQAQLALRAFFHEDRIDRPSLSRLADSKGYDMVLPPCPMADPRAPPPPSSAIYAALRLAVLRGGDLPSPKTSMRASDLSYHRRRRESPPPSRLSQRGLCSRPYSEAILAPNDFLSLSVRPFDGASVETTTEKSPSAPAHDIRCTMRGLGISVLHLCVSALSASHPPSPALEFALHPAASRCPSSRPIHSAGDSRESASVDVLVPWYARAGTCITISVVSHCPSSALLARASLIVYAFWCTAQSCAAHGHILSAASDGPHRVGSASIVGFADPSSTSSTLLCPSSRISPSCFGYRPAPILRCWWALNGCLPVFLSCARWLPTLRLVPVLRVPIRFALPIRLVTLPRDGRTASRSIEAQHS